MTPHFLLYGSLRPITLEKNLKHWRNIGPIATHKAPIEDTDQTMWLHTIGAHANLYLLLDTSSLLWTIRIHHECEGGIGKSVPRITDWHHKACRVMTNRDRQIFLSDSHTNKGFFFLLTTKYRILYWKNIKRAYRKSWIHWDVIWWCHFNITMMSQIDVLLACSCQFFIFPKAGTGMWDRIISHG